MSMELFERLRKLNVNISLVDERLDIEAAKGILTPELIDEIKLHKTGLIQFIKSYQRENIQLITPIPEDESYIMSSSQQRLWVLSQLEEGSLAYNISGTLRFEGDLDEAILNQSIGYIIGRHEILRTVFKENEAGELRQFILTDFPKFHIRYDNIIEGQDQIGCINLLYSEEQVTPFDLKEGPLLRLRLLKLSDQHHILFFTMHHIISDGWSMQVLSKELVSVYNLLKQGRSVDLPVLKIQYKDYAFWQNQLLKSDRSKNDEIYWLDQLQGDLPILDLPIAKPRPLQKQYRGSRIEKELDHSTVQKLKDLCLNRGCTLFMGLVSSLNALLYRYTGQEDIVIGTPIAGREHRILEDQIGLYLNTLALRTKFGAGYNFLDLLQDTQKVLLKAYAHQNYPFDRLISKLDVKRDTSRSILFDIMVVLQNQVEQHISEHQLADQLIITPVNQVTNSSQFDLTFEFIENVGALNLRLNYSTAIFSKLDIDQLFLHYEQLLKVLVENPGKRISELDYLNKLEKEQLLNNFNDTFKELPLNGTLVDLFEEQVKKTPDHIAVVSDDSSLSYNELAIKVNKLANYLRNKAGVQQKDLVGVMLARSEDFVVSVLAILKAGAAYVPIDINYPENRIKWMIEDSGIKVLLSEEYASLYIGDTLKQVVSVKQEMHEIRKENNICELKSDLGNLAYVIYTSGSTGQPKGVKVNHKGFLNLLSWYCEELQMVEASSVLLIAPVSFDLAQKNIFAPLIKGGRVYLSEQLHGDYKTIAKTIELHSINIINSAPSAFYPLLEITCNNNFKSLATLKYVVLGGEPISLKDFLPWLDSGYCNADLINSYGPTECTDVVSSYLSTRDRWKTTNTLPIGRPIHNTELYILDERLDLLPVGVSGEIYIGGEGVSNGYLHQPELTSEKFISNPFRKGKLIYKTGDIGRWLNDGNIEYLGRRDNQVKIRGYRIELGEIESHLVNFEGIKEAAVSVNEDEQGNKYLVAHIVSLEIFNVEKVMIFLAKFIPAHMIPTHFVQLDKLPLTPSGKLDRKSLSFSNKESYIFSANEYEAPKTAIELQLVEIWESILGRTKIGVKDNFFIMGGHSLNAIQLVSRIRRDLKLDVNINSIFRSQTIEELAKLLLKADQSQYQTIPNVADNLSYELSHAQQRLWLLSQLPASSLAYNMPGLLSLEGKLELPYLEKAIMSLLDRHEILRTVFKADSQGEIRQVILPKGKYLFNIEVEELPELSSYSRRILELSKVEQTKAFDLSTFPLLRCKILTVEAEKHILFFTTHHIISDGWSMGILARDLIEMYNALKQNRLALLPSLRIQYKDYAAWQNQLVECEMKSSKEYWLEQLDGQLPILDLPTDYARPLVKTYNGKVLQRKLSNTLSKSFKNLCSSNGCSLFMGLMSALTALLYRYTGQEDIIIGSPIAGRQHSELEDQIGLYLNTIALRTKFHGNNSFNELLSITQDILLGAYAHQNYPFDVLVDQLSLPRDQSRSVLFDVMLIYQNQSGLHNKNSEFAFEGLEVGTIDPLDRQTSQFDLTFEFLDDKEELVLNIIYNTDLYLEETIDRFALHYEQILESALKNPEAQIFSMDYISKEEKAFLLERFNNTAAHYPSKETVVELFERSVLEHPNDVALKSGDVVLTLDQLNSLSNRLARYLIELYRVQKGDSIAIKLERNEWMIISILAVLKAGCVYVPIDIKTPEQKTESIISNSMSTLLLASQEIQEFEFCANRYSSDNLGIYKTLESLFAIIYTTGSTGVPKGIKLIESNVLNRLHWMWEIYPFNKSEVGSIKTSIGFVDHIWEIFGPLLKGIESVVFDKETVLDVPEFIDQLALNKVSRIVLVPSLLKEILSYKNECKKLIHLKYWTCSGEALPAALVKDFYVIFREHTLLNIYGSTEVTADATFYDTSLLHAPVSKSETDLFHLKMNSDVKNLVANIHKWKIIQPDLEDSIKKKYTNVSLYERTSAEEYFSLLQKEILPAIVNVSSPKFIGHMTGPVPPLIKQLNELVVSVNQNLVKEETAGISSLIERQVLGIFHHLTYKYEESFYQNYTQNPDHCLGVITSGGTLSNITALGYALSKALSPMINFEGISDRGLMEALKMHGYEDVKVIGSSLCHYSIGKALRILGLGKNAFVPFDLDKGDLEESRKKLQHTIEMLKDSKVLVLSLIGVAGSTETGSIDSLSVLGEIANQYGIHYHVDAAFGGSYLFSSGLSHKLSGIELADSVAVCGHKQLYLPIGLSVCVFKDPSFAKYSENNTAYQARRGSSDLGKYTIEGSRPFMSLILHGALHVVGIKGYAEITEQNFQRAQLFAELIQKDSSFELMSSPELNIVLYRYIPQSKKYNKDEFAIHSNELNKKIQRTQFDNGNSFVSYTELKNGKGGAPIVWFRAVLMNPYTTQVDLLEILSEQKSIAESIENNSQLKDKNTISLSAVPIGKPIGNVQVYILDKWSNLCPIGVNGEICVGGQGVSGGYLSNDNLNSEKFILNPFKEGDRLYRTGDIGRWLPDGNIEYLGRSDDQVKIRGYRIELGEIESALLTYTNVKEASIIAWKENDSDSAVLIAYVVTQGLEVEEVRKYLAKLLPEYMIPTYFIKLDQLPLTSSGKVDRKSLPQPTADLIISNKEYIAARNELEENLVRIWEDVLNKTRIGVTDNFFSVGGHSLKIVKILAQIDSEFSVKIDIRSVFESPTIEALAELIENEQWINNMFLEEDADYHKEKF